MKQIEARFKLVTPCFVGSGSDNAELRVPSIKGVLRFWWRALYWVQFASKDGNKSALLHMRRREHELFGSSSKGQSNFLMRIETNKPPKLCEKDTILPVGAGARYLGYGVMEASENRGKGANLLRPCLREPFEFMLRISARKQAGFDEFLRALKLLGMIGGLGARSRKGYGSLNLIDLKCDGITCWRKPNTMEEYRKNLNSLLGVTKANIQEPEFSAFSANARIDLIGQHKSNALRVLDEYGGAMMHFRRWDLTSTKRGDKSSEHRIRKDRDRKKGRRVAVAKNDHLRRLVFGLPYNYGRNKRVVVPACYKRRASPLFFHVQELDGKFAGIALLLRSRFLPENEKIKVGDRLILPKLEWSALTDFLDNNSSERLWPNV